jgi:hypothetical protein
LAQISVSHKPLVEVLYSQACPQNPYFLAAVKDWLSPFTRDDEIELRDLQITATNPRVLELLEVRCLSELSSNVFIAVYVNGRQVSKVPLHPDEVVGGVRAALGRPPLPRPTAPWAWWGSPTHPDRSEAASSLSWVALTAETALKSLQLCLCHHPAGGRTPDAHHAAGSQLKAGLWNDAFRQVSLAGMVGLDGEIPAGLIEVYPRHIARDAGFVTGSGNDPTLTVTCIEVAGGYPRTSVIDQAMGHLLEAVAGGVGDYHWVEGVGVYGWPEGTNPYWVFDKHGFERVREIVPGRSVLMRRQL